MTVHPELALDVLRHRSFLALLDQQAVIRWISDPLARYLGVEPDALEGTNGLDLIHPDDHELFAAAFVISATTTGPWEEQQGDVRHADGSYRHVRLRPSRTIEHDGETLVPVWCRLLDLELQVNAAYPLIAAGRPWQETVQLVLDAETEGRSSWCSLHIVSPGHRTDDAMGPARFADEMALLRRDDLVDTIHAIPPNEWFGVADLSSPLRALATQFGSPSLHAAPITLSNGDRVATLLSWHDRPVEVGTPVLTQTVRLRVSAIRLALEQDRSRMRLERAATTDWLTGLANRRGFYQRLQTATSGGVAYLDLDGFKSINDRFGHQTGDELLVEFTQRVCAACRPGESLARVGGDEFVLLAPDADDATIDALRRRLLTVVHEPFQTESGSHRVAVSIGTAMIAGADDADRAVDRADKAMLAEKRRTRQISDSARSE